MATQFRIVGAGNTYFYHNQTTNSVGTIRL